MKKLLIILLMCLAFTWGVIQCQEARADHWRQTSSLLPGTYMLIYIDYTMTAQMAAMQAFAEMQGIEGTLSFVSVSEALTITINEEYTTEKMITFLNAEPQTTEDQKPMMFKSEGEWWRQIPMPCKWTKGDVGT
jgi:uncharacterized protein YccT (UPF0319 family)